MSSASLICIHLDSGVIKIVTQNIIIIFLQTQYNSETLQIYNYPSCLSSLSSSSSYPFLYSSPMILAISCVHLCCCLKNQMLDHVYVCMCVFHFRSVFSSRKYSFIIRRILPKLLPKKFLCSRRFFFIFLIFFWQEYWILSVSWQCCMKISRK